MAPERPTSPQDEIVHTPKMSVPGSPVAGTPIRDAQSPISILLAVAQSQNKTDDDLTNLNWLHEKDLLKGMNIISPSPSSSIHSTPIKSSFESQTLSLSPDTDYEDNTTASEISTTPPHVSSYVPNNQNNGVLKHNKHPHNIPYDPLVHTSNKPPYSFSCLIFMAIEDSVQKALPVKEIYAWILEHFPYFKNAPTGWKNSVRHNLSLNKCFQKVEKAPNLGKGSLWTVDPQYKPNLIQALSRTPSHSCTINPNERSPSSSCRQPISEKSPSHRLPNPELFPYLAKKLASSSSSTTEIPMVKREVKSENALDDVDAAAVMLSLKNAANGGEIGHGKGFRQVITTSPSEDHTYSAADTIEAIDRRIKIEGDQSTKNRLCCKFEFDDDEERRIKEGAETLLNLAGITLRKRTNSAQYEDFANKKIKVEYDINENLNGEEDEKPAPFKPRMLRVKKTKNNNSKVVKNNNNDDDWAKHRRVLEGGKQRR